MPNPPNNTTRSRRQPGTTERARALRKGDNLAEGRLWCELQDRKLGGFKFVRQLPIGPYLPTSPAGNAGSWSKLTAASMPIANTIGAATIS